MALYRVVDEGNPQDGPCYRAYQIVPLDRKTSEVLLNVNGRVNWDFFRNFKEDLVNYLSNRSILVLSNGASDGSGKLDEDEFRDLTSAFK